MFKKNINIFFSSLKLPIEWVQLFRVILSVYLAWVIFLSNRRNVVESNLMNRLLFIILLFLLTNTDIICGILLLLIYFFSFQSVLPIDEGFYQNEIENKDMDKNKETTKQKNQEEEQANKPFEEVIDENLKRIVYEAPTEPPPAFNIKTENIRGFQSSKYLDL
jgi:hypothetical protein